jgi:spore germination cell wall hydrolase CwlJ-like protein
MTPSDVVNEAYPITVAAITVYREARGESYAAKLGVARVLRNRTVDGRWPNTLDGVALQPKQFSSFNKTDLNATLFPLRYNKIEWEAFMDSARAVVESELVDPVDGANHYFDTSIAMPSWAKTMIFIKQIGKLKFYKG